MKLLFVCHQPRFKADMRPGGWLVSLHAGAMKSRCYVLGIMKNSKPESANRMELDMLSRLIYCAKPPFRVASPCNSKNRDFGITSLQ